MSRYSEVWTGNSSLLNVTSTVLVKSGPGILVTINIVTAGAAGGVYDIDSTGALSAANKIATIPAAVGQMQLFWPFDVGLVLAPGAGQVLSVSYT